MKLIALHSIKGLKPDDEYTYAGEAFDIDQEEGQRLIDLGSAIEEVEEEQGLTAAELEAEELRLRQEAEKADQDRRSRIYDFIQGAMTPLALERYKEEATAEGPGLIAAYEKRLAELAEDEK